MHNRTSSPASVQQSGCIRGQMGRVLKGYISSNTVRMPTNMCAPIESSTRKGIYNRMAIEAVELQIIPEEAQVVVRIFFELYANGFWPHRAVAAKAQSGGEIPSPLSARRRRKAFLERRHHQRNPQQREGTAGKRLESHQNRAKSHSSSAKKNNMPDPRTNGCEWTCPHGG